MFVEVRHVFAEEVGELCDLGRAQGPPLRIGPRGVQLLQREW